MPLSEHEQKLLEQMERALYAEDPKFATSMKGTQQRASRRRVLAGILAGAAGLAVVLFGVTIENVALGAVGFVLMVAGVAWALRPVPTGSASGPVGVVGSDGKVSGQSPKQRSGKQAKKKTAKPGLVARMEDRWERRRRTGGF